MRYASILAVILATGVLSPSPASAEPEFRWLNDWQYTTTPADANGSSSFGSTTADEATGGSNFAPPSNTIAIGGGPFTSVIFSRMFELSGDPRDWDVELKPLITGQFVHIRADLHLDFSATIEGTGYSIESHFVAPGGIPSGPTESLFPFNTPQVLADGIYTISGVNRVSLAATAPAGGIVASLNNTFSLSLQATPRAVPEPASLALLGLGGIGASLAFGRRRTARPTG